MGVRCDMRVHRLFLGINRATEKDIRLTFAAESFSSLTAEHAMISIIKDLRTLQLCV